MRDKVTPISKGSQSPESGISPAEAETLQLVAEGKQNAEIAQIRGVSVWTVKHQMGSAMDKLGCPNRTAAAVRWAEMRRAA